MNNPLSFEEFKKNPISAIAFLLVIAIGYLYVNQQELHASQLATEKESCFRIENELKSRISSLEETVVRYENRLEEINEKLLICLDSRK